MYRDEIIYYTLSKKNIFLLLLFLLFLFLILLIAAILITYFATKAAFESTSTTKAPGAQATTGAQRFSKDSNFLINSCNLVTLKILLN